MAGLACAAELAGLAHMRVERAVNERRQAVIMLHPASEQTVQRQLEALLQRWGCMHAEGAAGHVSTPHGPLMPSMRHLKLHAAELPVNMLA